MNEEFLPLNPADESSQRAGSLPRASSLLERIQAQREREAEMGNSNLTRQSSELNGGGGYVPPMADGGAASPTYGRVSINFDDYNQTDGSHDLMAGQYTNPHSEYSMKTYFITFVMDVYSLFRSIPVLAQVAVVVFLTWVVWKLI
eukprot:scaffold18525_cov190-Cylindrotheca_fusiformis.AAC.4